jgi:hypothetical protein
LSGYSLDVVRRSELPVAADNGAEAVLVHGYTGVYGSHDRLQRSGRADAGLQGAYTHCASARTFAARHTAARVGSQDFEWPPAKERLIAARETLGATIKIESRVSRKIPGSLLRDCGGNSHVFEGLLGYLAGHRGGADEFAKGFDAARIFDHAQGVSTLGWKIAGGVQS